MFLWEHNIPYPNHETTCGIPQTRAINCLKRQGKRFLEESGRTVLDKVHKLLARLGLVKSSRKIGSGSNGVLLFHATHLHAHVLGLDHHHHA